MRYWTSALVAVVAVGCATDRATAPNGTQSLSDADARVVGQEVAGEVEDVVGGFTIGGLLLPEFPSAGVAASASDEPRPTIHCPTITPFPPADADGDHVPDDVTLTFTLPDCSFTRDGRTLEITGIVHITDPSTTEFGVHVEFTAFQHKVTGPAGAFFLTRLNGVRQVLRSAAGFSLIDKTTTDRESSERGTAQLVKDWVVSFVADAGQTVAHERGLPSGDLTVNGSTTWTRGTQSHSLAVETVTPLHHDATCTAHPRFTSGELVVTKTGADGTVTIRIVFNGCGVDPTITVTRSAA
ncbi:MAG TPA: hypothetical protein VGQ06_11320 [Gemmatimonadales bacterium]|jgi:hypothetical protein|nr:hypothetical protein [Gemmatimonadales bacterium]